jgi:hypothetical protein
MFEDIGTIGSFVLPPDSGGSMTAFARMGYDLESALADIIDNSIDADARHVEITLFRDEEQIVKVAIADDGRGMSADKLREAMRFAGHYERRTDSQGAFGLGLKSSSFSQCQTLTVISRWAGDITACRWTAEEIKHGWRCTVLDPAAAADWFKSGYSVRDPPSQSGTLVVWERLVRLRVPDDLDEFLGDLLVRLDTALGLTFHRFIARGSLKIFIVVRHLDEATGIPRRVRPYDPFRYPRTGRSGYPKSFETSIPPIGSVQLQAHIWPAGSLEPEFKLGRRSGTGRQGIYIYRNDRLIQSGGWNGLVKDATDPELSLARVSLDLPTTAALDVTVSKSAIQVTAGLSQALEKARAGKASLRDYLEDARRTYRAGRRQPNPGLHAPTVPSGGIPIVARRALEKRLGKGKLYREIDFEWASLQRRTFFAVDDQRERVLLNKKYRKRVLHGARASAVDAPMLKLLLFLLLETDFHRERTSAKRKHWLEHCNAILFEVIKVL